MAYITCVALYDYLYYFILLYYKFFNLYFLVFFFLARGKGLPSIWKENHLNFEKMGGFIFRGTTHIIFMGRSTTGRKERKKNGGIQRGTGITY